MGEPQSKTEVIFLFVAGIGVLLFATGTIYLLRHWR